MLAGRRVLGALALGCLVLAAGAAPVPNAADAALSHAQKNATKFGLSSADLGEVAVSSTVVSRHSGMTHVYLQQRYRGIDVWSAVINVNVAKDGRVLSSGSTFVANIAEAAGEQSVQTSSVEAVESAADDLNLTVTKSLRVMQRKGGANDRTTLSDGGIAAKPIDAKLVWLPRNGEVRLAWQLEIDQDDGEHWWYAFVDAETGESLGQHDLITRDTADSIAAAIARPAGTTSALVSAAGALAALNATTVATFPSTDGATYRVFPLPLESPSDGDRALVANAADPRASPFGWHDTNGAAGPEFTVTRGNNVHAYADRDNNNVPDAGSDPDGGSTLTFDFPLNLDARPLDSQPAFVTNLFYWNNIVHDITYNYGFDEVGGNFQVNNYGNGGLGADDVRAEAQDGSGRNNANFGTDIDGRRPRMQMFEWRSSAPNPIVVHAPSPIAGTYFGPMAGFGESLTTTGPISGEVVYIGRGCDPAFQGGQPLDPYLANPSGKIALIDRGSCEFQAKVRKAEVNGAIMVIVANNIAGPATAMGGANPAIQIPSVMVSLDDGNLFRDNDPFNVTISDGTGGVPDRDSDLDAGVIAHEYGHGISNRLTGGPAVIGCLNNAEQMGEGWSDWFGMTLTTHPSDRPSTVRGVGTYVSFQPTTGQGIRPTPYTTNMAINPATYASVADAVNISQPHGIGYVWNSMLWEVYWNLVDRYGYNANLYAHWSSAGNNTALQLVMDGMKIQPCRPGFVDGRNAILTADQALTGGANQCEIWRGFAKRGLGFGASQGSSNNRGDGVQAFDLPAACTASTFNGYRAPLANAPTVNSRNAGSTINVGFGYLGDRNAIRLDSQNVDCTTLEITGTRPTSIPTLGMIKIGNDFRFNWKTDPSWAGTCRRLTVRGPMASDGYAFFSFR
jgi:extracellular elastinolytic metalloproteinase